MAQLSAVIITCNEEDNIARCLDSVRFADEIIVVDSGSTDNTVAISKKRGAEVYHKSWEGYGPAKQEAVRRASGEWILSIDADEVVTPELGREIKDIVSGELPYSGYYLKRKTMFMNRWIYHCGWYPDYILRLFRKSAGDFSDSAVHEKVIVGGKKGYLSGELLHYSYRTMEQYFDKFNRYTSLGAEEAYRAGRRAGWYEITVRPLAAFFKHYIARQGFKDGLEGFIISALSSMGVMTKYLKLREMVRDKEI